jgi:hypothetical protein
MGKTITTFLIDSEPQGVRYDSIGNRMCRMYVIPRSRLKILSDPKRTELRKPAFYILLGTDDDGVPRAYIGETENFEKRVKDHEVKKDFWQKALVFISIGKEGLIKTDVQYLEYKGIKEAKEMGTYLLKDNKQIPNMPNLEESRMSTMDEFYDDVKFLTAFLGCNIFKKVSSEKVRDLHYFFMSARGSKAKGYYDETGFTLLKRSVFADGETDSFSSPESRKKFLRTYSHQENDKFVLTADFTFSSPSTAACFVCGRNCNGWIEWKDVESKTLDEVYRKEKS